MRKSTKGALAASAAAVLLIGAWGTQASWTANGSIPGADANAGHLALTGGCDDWMLSVDLSSAQPVQLQTGDLLSPGDLLTLDCTFTVSVAGVNLSAELSTDAPTLTGPTSLKNALDVTTSYTLNHANVDNTSATVADATVSDGDTLTATITVAFTDVGGNLTQDLQGALDDITVTATQVPA